MRRRTRVTCSLLAAVAYLAIALWHFRAVLPAPATLLPEYPYLDDQYKALGRLDLAMVATVVTGNAHRLLHRPWAIGDEGQCHPLPRAYTLGEHMYGESVLAALPLALSGDPLVAYNVVLVLTVWIAALAMFALALHFTGNPAAAFVAGLLFCLEPVRIKDTGHPFVHGDLWAPLALLFLHRTFARGGFGNALVCALFLGLTLLESLYAVLSSFIVIATYAVYAIVRHRRGVRRWLAPLLCCAALVAGVAALVLGPYLTSRDTWEVLVRPGTMFMPLASYAPGQHAFPGWSLIILVLAALADRVWRRRDEEGEDPRLAAALGGLLVLWCSVRTLPLAGLEIPSPLLVLKQLLPGLDAVRALAAVGRGAVLGFALVAAYAVVTVRARLGHRAALLLAVVLSCMVLAERYVPRLVMANFGSPLTLSAYPARPADEDVALLRAHARGAILDLPYHGGARVGVAAGHYLLLTSYSPRATAACYNSYPSPLEPQLGVLASALPAPQAVDALVALGFETLLLHADRLRPRSIDLFTRTVQNDPETGARITPLGRTERLLAFRLASPHAVTSDPRQLVAGAADGRKTVVGPGRNTISIALRNDSERTFRHPAPIAPTPIEARWRDAAGDPVHVERARMLLPLAVAPGATAHGEVELASPERPGSYVLTIRLGDGSDAIVAWTEIEVAATGDDAMSPAQHP